MKTPINNGLLQSDIDFAGFTALNFDVVAPPTRKFDVKNYGALGDGTTDDTTAIQDALTAIPVEGGVLYFPGGTYKYTGSTLELDRRITVEGDGGRWNALSQINFTSPTLPLFSVVATNGCIFKNIALFNISGTTPTDGAGILVPNSGTANTAGVTDFDSVTVSGFYNDIDVRSGSYHRFDNCFLVDPVVNALKLANILTPDGGDHFVSNCMFCNTRTRTIGDAIRIESGGGVKIINCKINSGATVWNNGINLQIGSGVNTVDLLVSNCSIESFLSNGIKVETTAGGIWRDIVIHGNQISPWNGDSHYGINLVAASAGDIGRAVITGNCGNGASSNPFINLVNCTDVNISGNSQIGFSELVTIGTGVTFAATPVYIGRDARLVPIAGGTKLQARDTGTGAWADKDQWTNP